jgi:hypothetical protein
MATPRKDTADSAADKPARKAAQAKPKAKAKAEDATHEVLQSVVVDGEELSPGDSVRLEPLDAALLESHGYARKL